MGIICIQEIHLTDAQRFTLRGYELFRHDRANRHKGGIVTFVRSTIPAVEVGRSGGDSEYLAIRVVVQGRENTVISYYCPPDINLQLHTLPLVNHNLLITGDSNGHSPSCVPVSSYRWKIVYSQSKSLRLTFKCIEHFQRSVLCVVSFDLGTV